MDELHVGPDRIRQGYLRSSYRLAKTEILLPPSSLSLTLSWFSSLDISSSIDLTGFRNKCQALGEICRKRVVARRGEKPSVRRDGRGECEKNGYKRFRDSWLSFLSTLSSSCAIYFHFLFLSSFFFFLFFLWAILWIKFGMYFRKLTLGRRVASQRLFLFPGGFNYESNLFPMNGKTNGSWLKSVTRWKFSTQRGLRNGESVTFAAMARDN